MSKLIRGIFGVTAITLSLGVAQLASGSDYTQIGFRHDAATSIPLAQDINRAAKADRSTVNRRLSGQTVSINLVGQSVLVRIPDEQVEETRRITMPTSSKSLSQSSTRAVVACEPVVSVLTDIVRQLQPGRCLT